MISSLRGIVGNQTAERVLLHLYHYGEIHSAAIAADYKMASTPVRRQLDRFERAGVLVSRTAGRTRLYQFNPKSPIATALRDLVGIVYEAFPLAQRERFFSQRRRPRRRGKPVIRA